MIALTGFYAFWYQGWVAEENPIDDSSRNVSYICLVLSSHVYMIVLLVYMSANTGLYVCQNCLYVWWFFHHIQVAAYICMIAIIYLLS